jgi:hypothetical protein
MTRLFRGDAAQSMVEHLSDDLATHEAMQPRVDTDKPTGEQKPSNKATTTMEDTEKSMVWNLSTSPTFLQVNKIITGTSGTANTLHIDADMTRYTTGHGKPQREHRMGRRLPITSLHTGTRLDQSDF